MARVWRAVCSHKEILLVCFWVSDFISTLLKEKTEITQVEKDNGCHQTLLTNIILLIADQGDDTRQDLHAQYHLEAEEAGFGRTESPAGSPSLRLPPRPNHLKVPQRIMLPRGRKGSL